MELLWHKYKYYPYEIELAKREVEVLLRPRAIRKTPLGLFLSSPSNAKAADRLVYFSAVDSATHLTRQARLEQINGNGTNRQSTRYSAHGLHEYKGKFNPQVAKAILNMFGISPGSRVLDPFCGSGTALIEAAQLDIHALGTDINPLAVFIANAKVASLSIEASELRSGIDIVLRRRRAYKPTSDAREKYLAAWFSTEMLKDIEMLRHAISDLKPAIASILFACASDLLREYSHQDPLDLRIRRRKSPIPSKPFRDAFTENALRFAFRMENAQHFLGKIGAAHACLLDSRDISPTSKSVGGAIFDCALTSPPYATALPYIDTQRLSLVWLGLVEPDQILPLEARLVGSRESRGLERKGLATALHCNSAGLPKMQIAYCRKLLAALGESDGFRRKAVPTLLYRYFAGMRDSFRSVRSVMRKGAPYALIVGGNHTTLGGKRFDINTPSHLAALAESAGWKMRETIALQTYQRYGYHMGNAVASEAMIILEAE